MPTLTFVSEGTGLGAIARKGQMKRLTICVFQIWVTIALIIATDVMLSRARREPGGLETVGLDLCQAPVCFKQFRLGEALWSAVYDQLIQEGYSSTGPGFLYKGEIGSNIEVVNTGDKTQFTQMQIHLYPPILTVGELVTEFGMPCVIIYATYSPVFELLYPNIRVIAPQPYNPTAPTIERLNPNLPVYLIDLYPTSTPCAKIMSDLERAALKPAPWLGFASIQTYKLHSKQDQ